MPSAELNHSVAWCGPENSKPKSHYKKTGMQEYDSLAFL